MFNIRRSIFETNSSSEHAVCVKFDKYCDREYEIGEEEYELVLSDSDIKYLLRSLPTEMLKKEIKERHDFEIALRTMPTEMLKEELNRRGLEL